MTLEDLRDCKIMNAAVDELSPLPSIAHPNPCSILLLGDASFFLGEPILTIARTALISVPCMDVIMRD